MKLFGSIKELVSAVFRKNSQEITLRPSQTTTYTAARDVQLPPGDTAHELVSATSTQTLTNKSIDADTNTVTNIENADIKAAAAIARTKLASGSISHVVVNDGAGAFSSEAQLAGTRGGTGVSSTATFPTSGVVVTEAGTQTLTNKTVPFLRAAEQSSTPSTPASGFGLLYPKTDNSWYILNDLGVETQIQGAGGILGLSAGGTNKNMTAVAGGVVYTDADSLEVTAAGTSGDWVLSGGSGAPTLSSTTLTAKVFRDNITPVTIGSDADAGTRQLDIKAASSQRASINLYQSTVSKTTLSTANASNDLVPDSATGDTVLRMNNQKLLMSGDDGNTKHWVMTSGGVITTPKQSYVQVYRDTSTQGVTTSTFTSVDWNAEAVDRNGDFDTSTNLFTAPVDGIYCISTSVQFSGTAMSRAMVRAVVNSVGYIFQDLQGVTTSNGNVTGSICLPMTAAQTVAIEVFLVGTSPLVQFGQGATWLTIYKAG